MKIFIAGMILDQLDSQTGEVTVAYKSFVQYLLDGLRRHGHEVFCAVEQDNWQQSDKPPEVGLLRDLDGITSCDAVIALVSDKTSASVQFELGYAVASDKPVVLAQEASLLLSWFNQGTVGAGLVTLVSYANVAMLLDQLDVALTAQR